MATVKSLGLHKPAGLHHAVQENLIQPDAPASSYVWDVTVGEDENEDELLTTKTSVVWCRGRIFRKAFKFDLEKEPVTQALLAHFPSSEANKTKRDASKKAHDVAPTLEKALVVFLKTQAHIYFLSGTSHIVHMPFEVESAVAGPVGVVIQRKAKAESTAPVSLKFPRAPPSSFVSSQITAFNSSQQTTFSVEGLGNPKALHLSLRSTLENMWDAPMEQPESHWPRLLSLTDPLAEIGLVVTDPESQAPRTTRRATAGKPVFLDPAEEILHIEQIDLPVASAKRLRDPLVLGVSINRETSSYSVWRMTYLRHEDQFIGQNKKTKKQNGRRRSSMQPGFASGTSTPVQQNFRESFGAPLPGKRQRKSEKLEKPLDLVTSLEQQDTEGPGVARRSSRRLSSMLARADLSASHERSVFADQPLVPNTGVSKRHEHGRSSSSFQHPVRPSLGSLLEAPIDAGLDEGLHNMGLDDHDFDGLQREILFTRIHTISLDNTHLRYSTSTRPARDQSKVFILTAPAFAIDDQQRTQLLIAIQDSFERRLQLITLHVKVQDKFGQAATSIVPREQWKVQNVVDSSKLVDGDLSVILVLSEAMDGRHELSTQAPWIELTKVSLSLLFVDDTRDLQYRGRAPDRDVKHRKSEVIDLSNGGITGIRFPRKNGLVDVADADGRLHQLKIQLQPSCPQVRRALEICRSVLPDSLGGRVHAGWLHAMQWLNSQGESVVNVEWSALAVLLFASFLNLGRSDVKPTPAARLPVRRKRPPSGSFGSIKESEDWRALEMSETTNALGCPVWMLNKGWQWALDEDEEPASLSLQSEHGTSQKFVSRHIALAREYMASPLGEAALGASGYLPTALGRNTDARRKVAVDIFMALHLLLEEQKLDITTPEYVSPGRADLRVLLCQIARWLKWHGFWSIYELGIQEDVDSRHDTDIYFASSRLSEAEKLEDSRWDLITPRTLMMKRFFKIIKPKSTAVQMVEAMRDCGFTSLVLETLPEAVLAPLLDAISLCQPHPPSQWSHELLELVNRSDISLILSSEKRPRLATSSILAPTHVASWDFRLLCQSVEETNSLGYDEGDGTERQAVIRALFKDDRRLNEAQDLLSTHKARVVRLDPNPSWPESEYLEKQKELVSRIATGTLAIPAGRALLYFSLRYPLITQKFHIGGFNLNCVVKPANVTVGVDKALFTEEKVCWGFFHQGVAAGLAISPQAKGIDTSWILYNKPGQELSNRHAGFLLALGLNGHLKGVAKWVAFKYLTPKHTMTSIGLLLGLAASYMGTMDSLITRLLSVHATRMLPRGAAELNLSPLTQTSGIMGIGLLYCNSQHRRMSEIMLSEIEHVDDEDEEEPLRSECYRLAAGFALGLINLGKGNDLKGLHDMRLTEKLVVHATATKNVDIVHILDRAAAGAVMAIALIFMKSEDQIVARKIDVPDSVLQFDYIRPDILLLRTVTKNLILWSKIEPTFAWVHNNLPAAYRHRHKLMGITKLRSIDLSFYSILTGLCLSVALRFSGSASTKVRDLLLHYLDQFMRISRIPATPREHPDAAPRYDEELARSNARMCQDIVALSCSIVMAGTGDIPVLRRLRALHGRDDPDTPYGSHLAAHLAIGSLFLGCGTATFGSSNKAIAALLIAFYPVFPTTVMDNRAHLQAFRYFWVLAAEQRCLVAKDSITGQPVSVSVQIKMKDSSSCEHVQRTTPCLLPPLDEIASLSTSCGPQYWDVELDFSNEDVKRAFTESQSLYLQRRPPREGEFTSTLRELGKDTRGENPFEWLFNLEPLQDVTHAEKASLLEATNRQAEVGSALDARLELERGISEGGDRERLEGARLLFEWGATRHRLLKTDHPPSASQGAAHSQSFGTADSQSTIRPPPAEGSSSHREDSPPDTPPTPRASEDVWWMRDSAIEALKGKVWLAAQEGSES
ncbi:anaphase-promoting complex subunit 1 [Purpureocillium lilacinum]|nr:anaphase-promoting complex subunit 1 [Purpureocillium lilacinum]